jgi:hypothetical protein
MVATAPSTTTAFRINFFPAVSAVTVSKYDMTQPWTFRTLSVPAAQRIIGPRVSEPWILFVIWQLVKDPEPTMCMRLSVLTRPEAGVQLIWHSVNEAIPVAATETSIALYCPLVTIWHEVKDAIGATRPF